MNLLEHDCEYCMRPRGGVIHLGGCRGPRTIAHPHVLQKLTMVLDLDFCQVFDIWAFDWRFSDFEIVWRIGSRLKEISDMLVVHFEV